MMELAIGIGFEGIQLTAHAVNQEGAAIDLPLKDLYKRGLPTCAKPARRRIDTNLASWGAVDGQAYLDAFGFKGCRATEINHQFFEVKSGRRTYIVPALALMRALFRPTKNLLPEMFMPQALDRQCRLVVSESGNTVEVDALWATRGIAERCSDWGPLFAWMMAYPSAYDMAGSVHAQAMNGRFGLRLPMADFRTVFGGLDVGATTFVTDVSAIALTPLDEPSIEISGATPVVHLVDRKYLQEPEGRSERFTAIPLHLNGNYELTDLEWAEIEPFIVGTQLRARPFELSQREILNSVLHKLGTGLPWRQAPYKVGNWSNAFSAFRKWSTRGTLEAILSVLHESRKAP